MRGWVGDERDQLRSHRRLTDASRDWELAERDNGLLARGARLAELQERPPDGLNPLESEFLGESVNQSLRERLQRRRRVRIAIGGLSGSVVAVSALAGFALVKRNDASDARDSALSRQVAGSAREQLSTNPELSILLARRAYRVAPTREAEEALRQAVYESTLRVSYRGQSDGLTAVDTSPDGTLAVTSSSDGSVHVWRTDTGELQAKLPDHKGGATSVVFARDGSAVFSAGTDGVVRRSRLSDGTSVVLLRSPAPVNAIALADKVDALAIVGDDKWLNIIKASTGRRIARSDLSDKGYVSVAIDSNGLRVLFGDQSSHGRIWRVGDPASRVILTLPGQTVRGVDFSPDGRRALMVATVTGVTVFDDRFRVQARIPGAATRAQFSRDGRRVLVAASSGGMVADASDGSELNRLVGHTSSVAAVAESGPGLVVTASGDHGAKVWRWRAPLADERAIPAAQGYLDLGDPFPASDGSVVSVLAGLGTSPAHVLRWRPTRGTLERGAALPNELNAFAFDLRRRRIVFGTTDGRVIIQGLGAGHAARTLRSKDVRSAPDKRSIQTVALSGDGQWVSAGGLSGRLQTWNVASGDRTEVVAKTTTIWGVDMNSDGSRIATAGEDGVARIWERGSNRPTLELRGHQGSLDAVRFSGDGAFVASVGADRTARVWEVANGRPVALIRADSRVVGVQFSGDSRQLLLATQTGLESWDWRREVKLVSFRDRAPTFYVGFAPNNSIVTASQVSLADDRSALRRYTCEVCGSIGDVLRLSERRVTRSLTTDEERSFLAGVQGRG